MDIRDVQTLAEEVISRIDKKLGIKHDNETAIIHLIEEIGELSRQIMNPKLKRDNINANLLSEEIADSILLISKLANNSGIDIEDAIKSKVEKLKQRHNL